MIHIDSMYDGDGRVRACVWERMTQLFDLEMLCVCVCDCDDAMVRCDWLFESAWLQ